MPPMGGFSFDLCRRNEMLVKKGLKQPSYLKTGTTIVGLIFEVSSFIFLLFLFSAFIFSSQLIHSTEFVACSVLLRVGFLLVLICLLRFASFNVGFLFAR